MGSLLEASRFVGNIHRCHSEGPSLPTLLKAPFLSISAKTSTLPIILKAHSLPAFLKAPSLPIVLKAPSLPVFVKAPSLPTFLKILLFSKLPTGRTENFKSRWFENSLQGVLTTELHVAKANSISIAFRELDKQRLRQREPQHGSWIEHSLR